MMDPRSPAGHTDSIHHPKVDEMENSIVQFKHKGKTYDVRVLTHDKEYTVQVHKDDKPLGIKYTVTFETAFDFKLYNGESAKAALVEIAKGDVIHGRIAPD